jgi:hypothetical protein
MSELAVLDLSNPDWETFDPTDGRAGPVEYPDFLTGKVDWLRPFTDGPLETENGSIGISICHMQGDPTPAFEESFAVGADTNAETETMVLFEGSAEATLPDGRVLDIEAPCVVHIPRGSNFGWRYKTQYRGIYIIIW